MLQSVTNKGMASYQLLGDIVNSRAVDDRSRLHRDVVGALGAVNAQVSGIDGLDVTVGDEFQGRYRTLGAALDAALRIRLHLLPRVDVRIGIGYGAVENLDDTGRLQDGPGWWAAREAIEGVESSARRAGLRSLRTAYRGAAEPATEASVNAALVCQDQVIGSMPERPVRILHRLLLGDTQAAIAADEGVSPSAVSQQVRAHGIGAILHAHDLLKGMS